MCVPAVVCETVHAREDVRGAAGGFDTRGAICATVVCECMLVFASFVRCLPPRDLRRNMAATVVCGSSAPPACT